MPFRLWLLLPWIPFAAAQNNSLPAREAFSYTVEWRLITAGKVQMEWQQDNAGAQIHIQVRSVGMVSKLFRVEDDYRAALNSLLCAESAQLLSHEGNRERETRIAFDSAARKASYLEKDRIRNTVLLSKDIDTAPCVHDVPGGLYFLRTMNLEPGQSATLPVSDGKKFAMARVEAQQREDVKTPEGVFHTVRYEIYLFNNVIYRRPAHLNVWLTDDRRRLPVQVRVRMQFTIGTISLLLEKHE
jgi:hypothetical protein